MRSFITLALSALPLLSTAYIVDPLTTAAPDTIEECTNWAIASETDTCETLVIQGGDINLEQFQKYNPTQAAGCNLIVGNSYCIEKFWGIPDPTPTPTPSTSSTTSGPTSEPTTLLEFCEASAYARKDACPQCLSRCANETKYIKDCFQSVFMYIDRDDSTCWQHGWHVPGGCASWAVDQNCPKAE